VQVNGSVMERSRYTDVLGWVPFRRSDCPWVGPSYALSSRRDATNPVRGQSRLSAFPYRLPFPIRSREHALAVPLLQPALPVLEKWLDILLLEMESLETRSEPSYVGQIELEHLASIFQAACRMFA